MEVVNGGEMIIITGREMASTPSKSCPIATLVSGLPREGEAGIAAQSVKQRLLNTHFGQ
jgi:hypothetical protein